jgi:hypothetical protein
MVAGMSKAVAKMTIKVNHYGNDNEWYDNECRKMKVEVNEARKNFGRLKCNENWNDYRNKKNRYKNV